MYGVVTMEDALATKILDMQSLRRTAPFRAICESDAGALAAYEWSLDLGQALLKPIGIMEVAVRNAVDGALFRWWNDQGYGGTWIDVRSEEAPVSFLSPFVHASEWRSRARSSKHGCEKEVTHDDVIAHTSLGTWRNMIGNPAAISSIPPAEPERRASWEAARRQDVLCAELWRHAIRDAFPSIPETKKLRLGLSPRAYIGARLTRISFLRNRVCHWDNLLAVDIPGRYDDIKRLTRAVDPCLSEWLCGQCDEEITDLLVRKPTRQG